MRTLPTSLFLVAGLTGVTGLASANAFYINEHDAKATGRGGANTATDTDPSSIVFNPGGIALGEGTAVAIGGAFIAPSASYTDPAGAKTDSNNDSAVVPQMFITSRVHDMVAVGLGFHMPFGLAIGWPCTNTPTSPECSASANSPQADVITKQSLRTYFITPSVGVNLNKVVPGLSAGGGLDLVPATVELQRKLFFGDAEGYTRLGGDAFGIGGRLGVMYHPAVLPKLSVGVMWRSQVTLDFSGKADFDIADPYRGQLPPDGDIKTSITLPMSLAGGVAFRPTEGLEIELNAVWINWAKFNQLAIDLPGGTRTVAPQDYQNTTTIRIGAEYHLPAIPLAVRAGYIYDPTPIPATTVSAQLPDVNRNDVTVGGTYAIGEMLDVSLGLLYVLPASRKTSDAQYMPLYKGSYDVSAFVANLGLVGRFGR